MSKPGEQTGKPICKTCGEVIFESTALAGVWHHAPWVKIPDHNAQPSAAPVVTKESKCSTEGCSGTARYCLPCCLKWPAAPDAVVSQPEGTQAVVELVRLAAYIHNRDGHNQYFARCEHDICRRAATIGGVQFHHKLPEADYGVPGAFWTHSAPTEQAYYWHWHGDPVTGPIPRAFVAYPDSRWCDEIGGWWKKIECPSPPSLPKAGETAQACSDCGSDSPSKRWCELCCRPKTEHATLEPFQPCANEVFHSAAPPLLPAQDNAIVKCFKVSRPDFGKKFCVYRDLQTIVDAEFDGCEVGDGVLIEIIEMSDTELRALPDFEGW